MCAAGAWESIEGVGEKECAMSCIAYVKYRIVKAHLESGGD